MYGNRSPLHALLHALSHTLPLTCHMQYLGYSMQLEDTSNVCSCSFAVSVHDKWGC